MAAKKLAWLGGSFGAGLFVSTLYHRKISDNDIFNFTPLRAATANVDETRMVVSPPSELVPAGKGMSLDDSVVAQSRSREIMKHGYPSLDNLRIFDNYVLSYDRRNRVANWVFEHLTYARMKPGEDTDRGKSEFKEDTFIHPFFRSTNGDYKASGYDRGHLAAAANHRSSQRFMDQTFFLSNIAPQVGVGFNRDKWNDLEKEVRLLAKNHDNVWVCTGPLYLPRFFSSDYH